MPGDSSPTRRAYHLLKRAATRFKERHIMLTRRTLLTRALIGAPAILHVGSAGANAWTTAAQSARGSTRSGARFPNVPLITHENTRVRFYDDLVKGKLVLINFFFASCTGICPRTAANLRRVQDWLGERLGRDAVILSITVDPERDSPDVLGKYARQQGARRGWYFLTGTIQDLEVIRRSLGAVATDPQDGPHTGVLTYGNDATGRWLATYAGARPALIIEALERLAH
jgi:protein SCO1